MKNLETCDGCDDGAHSRFWPEARSPKPRSLLFVFRSVVAGRHEDSCREPAASMRENRMSRSVTRTPPGTDRRRRNGNRRPDEDSAHPRVRISRGEYGRRLVALGYDSGVERNPPGNHESSPFRSVARIDE